MLTDADLLGMPRGLWTVKGVIPATGIGSIFGPPMSGKSFLTLDLLAHIVHGKPWFGRKVSGRFVVYVPFEGRGGIPDRIRAWRWAHGNSDSGIRFIYDGLNLLLRGDRDRLVAALMSSGMQKCVLCIDTLAQAGPGIDENSSEGMGAMIAAFHDLQMRLGCVVLVVHHTGKDAERGMRGWSGLLGAMDFAIECQHSDEKDASKYDRRFRLAKVKDGEDGQAFDFTMRRVELGEDEDGDMITSLVVEQKLRAALEQPKPKPKDKEDDDPVRDAADDDFVLAWINRERAAENYPSRNSLESQLGDMKLEYAITQIRVRKAVHRLLGDNKIANGAAKESPSNNAWLYATNGDASGGQT